MDKTIIFIVCALGSVGVVAWFCSICSLCTEPSLYKNLLGIDIASDAAPEEHAGNIEAKLNKKQISRNSHLGMRLQQLISITLSERHMQLPSIGDMRALSQEYEQGKLYCILQQNIVSTLLIIGICGTLYGVHTYLGGKNNGLEDLKPALEPSMYAVGFTILLLILRAIYTRWLYSYLNKLDRYTLDTLVPALQPNDDYESVTDELVKTITPLKQGAWKMSSSAESMHKLFAGMKASIDKLVDMATTLQRMIGKQKDLANILSSRARATQEQSKRLGELQKNMSYMSTDMQQQAQKLAECNRAVHATIEQIGEYEQSSKKLDRLSNSEGSGIWQKIYDAALCVSSAEDKLPDMLKALRETGDKEILQMEKQSRAWHEEIEAFRENALALKEATESMRLTITEVGTDISNTKNALDQACSATGDYKQQHAQAWKSLNENPQQLAEAIEEINHAAVGYMAQLRQREKAFFNQKGFFGKWFKWQYDALPIIVILLVLYKLLSA